MEEVRVQLRKGEQGEVRVWEKWDDRSGVCLAVTEGSIISYDP